MLDLIGQELEIGDVVAITSMAGSKIFKKLGVIVEIKQRVHLVCLKNTGTHFYTCFSENYSLVKVDISLELFAPDLYEMKKLMLDAREDVGKDKFMLVKDLKDEFKIIRGNDKSIKKYIDSTSEVTPLEHIGWGVSNCVPGYYIPMNVLGGQPSSLFKEAENKDAIMGFKYFIERILLQIVMYNNIPIIDV